MENPVDRYRLALALIPDADVAGDLFMAARSEADLRRRAARWRAGQGLPPPDQPLVLPVLDASMSEYALHLARRGAVHRRLTVWLTTAGLLLTVLSAGYLLREMLIPTLERNPVYSQGPIVTTGESEGLFLSIYQMKVAAGPEDGSQTISIWWEIAGVGAADSYRLVRPELELSFRPGPYALPVKEWLETTTTRRYSTRPDRVLGVSYFRVKASVYRPQALFRLIQREQGGADLAVNVVLPQAEG